MMHEREDPATASWHADRRIPIAMILAIVIQTASIIWWAAGINGRVGTLESQNIQTADQPGRIVRLETQFAGIDKTLDRLERKLDKLLAPETKP